MKCSHPGACTVSVLIQFEIKFLLGARKIDLSFFAEARNAKAGAQKGEKRLLVNRSPIRTTIYATVSYIKLIYNRGLVLTLSRIRSFDWRMLCQLNTLCITSIFKCTSCI